jgi:hypothetical protein
MLVMYSISCTLLWYLYLQLISFELLYILLEDDCVVLILIYLLCITRLKTYELSMDEEPFGRDGETNPTPTE